jgi:hypothetical protein
LIDAAGIISDQNVSMSSPTERSSDALRTAAIRALSLRPLDSRIWLVLALITSESSLQSGRAKEQIKMSYYTGPNDKAVMDPRLKAVVRLHALDDPDVRELVQREIRTILLRAPELRPSIISAYAKANEGERAFIEATVSATDPSFVGLLRAGQH